MSALIASLPANVIAGFRLALFMPVTRDRFRIGAGDYALLAAFNVLVWIAGSRVRAGADALFVPEAALAMLAYIPVVLVFCLAVARLIRIPESFAGLAVMIASTDLLFEIAGTLMYLLLDDDSLPIPPQAPPVLYAAYVLWAMASVLRALRLVTAWGAPGAKKSALLLMLMVLLLVYLPRNEPWEAAADSEDQEEAPTLLNEEILARQDGLLQRQLDRLARQRSGQADLYFLGAAPYGGQPTFVAELAAVHKLMDESFDTRGRSVSLMNHSATLGAVPLATVSNLRLALGQIGELLDREEDVLLLFLTSHGTPDHLLAFDLPPMRLNQLNPTMLARMLADSGIKWKIIVLSACYAGGFIESLRDDNSLIIAAAAADRQSFGCEASSEFTWFSRAYFDQALREEARAGRYSFTAAFEGARERVAAQEQAGSHPPSQPQIFLGSAMREKLRTLESRLAAQAGHTPGPVPDAP